MPIREFSQGIPRARIAFFPELPLACELERFRERRFQCLSCTQQDLESRNFVATLDAVVFVQRPDQRIALEAVLRATLRRLLDQDVRVYVRIAPDPDKTPVARRLLVDVLLDLNAPVANLTTEEFARVSERLREREGSFLAPYVYLVESAADPTEFSHTVCDHPAGRTPNPDLRLEGCDVHEWGAEDAEERTLLLQRAFADCSTLCLERMADGLSGAPVFKAWATLREPFSNANWPYLHFVKLGARKKISDEYYNYLSRALDYVPFHLGPRLRLDRCNLGSSQGVLVGDFVEGAEPIRDCAPSGRAGPAITNLFERTLGAWRKLAKPDPDVSLSQHLEKKWFDDTGDDIHLPAARADIVRALGGNPDLSRSRQIFDRHPRTSPLCAPAHGDLHATNVLVRAGDAIIIDFEKVIDCFPLLYDPASLEGGLLVEALAHDPRSDGDLKGLHRSIEHLYSLSVLENFVPSLTPSDPAAWFYDCVRQIRTLSRHAEQPVGQYALVLSLVLIRKGCNCAKFKRRYENLRALAFVLGQKILEQIGARHP